MTQLAQSLIDCFARGSKVLIAGNGGSSAEASHLSEELISHGFPAIALNDPQVLTALANDFSYEEVFSKYVEALGKKEDILITISTSGKSKNLLNAAKMALAIGMIVIEWPRNKGVTTEEIQNEQLKLMHKIYKEVVNAS